MTSWYDWRMAVAWLMAVGIASMMRNAVALRETERRTAQLMLEKWQLENALQLAQLETLRSRCSSYWTPKTYRTPLTSNMH